MNRRVSIIALPLILLMMTGGVMAQEDKPAPNGRKSPLGVLARFLELTEEQVEATKSLFEERKEDLQPLREELKTINEQWKEEISSDDPDPLVLGNLAIARRDIGKDIVEVKRITKEAFLALLDEDQASRLRALRRAERLQPIVKITRGIDLY